MYVRTCNQRTYVCTCMQCIDSGVHELVHKGATIVLYLYVHKIVVTHWRLGSATQSMTQSCLLMWEALYIPTHFPQQVHTCTHMLSSPLCVHAYSLRTKLRIQTCMCIWLQEHHCRCTVHTHVHMYMYTTHQAKCWLVIVWTLGEVMHTSTKHQHQYSGQWCRVMFIIILHSPCPCLHGFPCTLAVVSRSTLKTSVRQQFSVDWNWWAQ